MPDNPQTTAEARRPDDDELDLGQLIGTLMAGKWLIALSIAVAVAIGGWQAYTATPIYKGDMLLQVERQQVGIPGLSNLLGSEAIETETEIELLRSRMVVGKVVDQLDLAVSAAPIPGSFLDSLLARGPQGVIEIGRMEVAPQRLNTGFILVALGGGQFELIEEQSGEVLGRGAVDQAFEFGGEGTPELALFVTRLEAEAGERFWLSRSDRLRAIQRARAGLEVTGLGWESGILVVTLEHPDRGHIERLLNALGNSYVRQNVERRSAEAARSLEFLDEQLPLLRAELEQAEDAYNEFRSEFQAVDLESETRSVLGRLVELESELSRLRMEEISMRLQFGPDHPQMQALRTRRDSLEAARAELEKEVSALPERQQDLLRLRREIEVNTHLYTSLLNSAQELRVAQAGTVGNVRIVDHAAVGFSPVRPRKPRILMISLVLGALLGTVAVFGREMLRRGITDPDTLEQHLGFPVYAVVPHSRAQARNDKRATRKGMPIEILARDLPTDGAVESLRSLRTALNFALMDEERNVVVVTSPGPASGKTFLSVNLAWVLGQSKQKVLLIDADLRRGHIHAYLEGRRRTPGLSEVLSGQSWLEDALVPLVPGVVDVLPSGEYPPNPSELLMRPEFGALLKKLQALYDVVLIDTPPVLAATDGVIVARHAGPLFMAVRAGQTTERETRAALRRLSQVEIKVTGLLFNDLETQAKGYGYEHYGYSYEKKAAKGGKTA